MTTPLLPTLADALTRQGLRLRPRSDADALQLDTLYQQWRAEQFAASGLAPAERLALAAQQCQMQQLHYQRQAEPLAWGVLEWQGEVIGRLYLQLRDGHSLHVLDMLLHPDWRGRGLGGALLAAVQAHARQHGWQATLAVELTNPRALQLYQRLGFVVQGMHGVHAHLAWTAAP